MAVESLPLPLLASVKAVPALQPRMSAERYRAAIAIAAASVFITGVGSVYVSVQAQALDAAPSPALATAPVAIPAEAVVVAAPARDTGPTRRWGPGSAVDIEEATLGVKRAPMYETVQQTRPLSVSTSGSSSSSRSTSSASATSSSASSASSSSSSASSAGTSSRSSGSSYVVREGDDFGAIAARLGISSTRVASLNPGVDSTQLSIGQTLRIG